MLKTFGAIKEKIQTKNGPKRALTIGGGDEDAALGKQTSTPMIKARK